MENISDIEIKYRQERAVSYARTFFVSMVLLLQVAVLSAKGVETTWPFIKLTTPPLPKEVWGYLALLFLILALATFIIAYRRNFLLSKFGNIIEQSFAPGIVLAFAATGIGLIQGFALAFC